MRGLNSETLTTLPTDPQQGSRLRGRLRQEGLKPQIIVGGAS
jgi:hypothetical protein